MIYRFYEINSRNKICHRSIYQIIFKELLAVNIYNSVYPRSRKGRGNIVLKRVLLHERGTFMRAFQYRGHFCNGPLMHVLPCYSLFPPTLSPPLSFHRLQVLSLTPFSHPLVPPLFPLSHPCSVSYFFQH